MTGRVALAFALAALAAAIVGIFVPISGILFSCGASALAVIAALLGERRYAAIAAIVIAVNSVLFSPLIWMTVVPPGQLIVAGYVACLVGAPFAAMWLTHSLPQYRFAIVGSVIWALVAPAVLNGIAERRANDVSSAADMTCMRTQPASPERNKLCYDTGKAASEGMWRPSYALLFAVSLVPPALAWLGYWLIVRRRRVG